MIVRRFQAVFLILSVLCIQTTLPAQESATFSEVDVEILRSEKNAPVLARVTLINGDDPKQIFKGSLVSHEDAKDVYHFEQVPTKDKTWRINAMSMKFSKNKAPEFGNSKLLKFNSSHHTVTLEQTTEEQTGLIILVPKTATDVEGKDSSGKVFPDDPLFRPFLDEDGQKRGHEILSEMYEVNKYWLLTELPPEIESFSYDFLFQFNTKHTFPAQVHADAQLAERRGVTLRLILDFLVEAPDEILFRDILEADDRITLNYALRKPARLLALIGMENDQKSRISRSIQVGTLILDRKTMTPVEHNSLGANEAYSDYVEIKPGKFAPLKITFPGSFEANFQIVEPGLWIFSSGVLNHEATSVRNVDVVRRHKP